MFIVQKGPEHALFQYYDIHSKMALSQNLGDVCCLPAQSPVQQLQGVLQTMRDGPGYCPKSRIWQMDKNPL